MTNGVLMQKKIEKVHIFHYLNNLCDALLSP
jgi:hypothetical protein